MPSPTPGRDVQSVELLLDEAGDARVLALWTRLLEAGLPSQARHRSPSNRPHITMVALPGLPTGVEPRLVSALAGRLPAQGRWGALEVFGSGPYTVVWLVEPDPGLQSLHADLARLCEVPDDHLTSPGRWTPHVTLARRVREADLDAVRRLVEAPVTAASGRPVLAPVVRRWDGVAKLDWRVEPGQT